MRTLRPVEHFLQDLRFGARLLARGRGFTTVAVLSLALGIGASSAIFSLINAIVLRPLPVAEPQELYIAQVTEPDGPELQFSYPVVEQAAALLAGRAEVAAQSTYRVGAHRDTRRRRRSESGGTGRLAVGGWRLLWRPAAACANRSSARPRRQSGPRPASRRGDQRSYWRRRFGRSARVLETELIINGAPMAIVGVALPGFFGTTVDTETPDIWAPAQMQASLRFAGNYDLQHGDVREAVAVPTRTRMAAGHGSGSQGARTGGGRRHDRRTAGGCRAGHAHRHPSRCFRERAVTRPCGAGCAHHSSCCCVRSACCSPSRAPTSPACSWRARRVAVARWPFACRWERNADG